MDDDDDDEDDNNGDDDDDEDDDDNDNESESDDEEVRGRARKRHRAGAISGRAFIADTGTVLFLYIKLWRAFRSLWTGQPSKRTRTTRKKRWS